MDDFSKDIRKTLNLDFDFPSNIKEFAKTAFGVKEPITEKDLSKEDINFLKNQIGKTKQNVEQKEKQYVNDLITSKNELKDNLSKQHKASVMARISELQKKIESFEKTRGKTSVKYSDYPTYGEDSQHEWGLWKGIKESFSNPAYRMETLLGRYNVYDNKNGTVTIVDKHDWNNNGFKGIVAQPEIVLDGLKSIILSGINPEQAGNFFMRVIRPEASREVRITIPMNEQK